MLLVMKEAITGINNFLKITKILKIKKMNIFFLNDDVTTCVGP